jgi:hypothetical protein
MIGVIFRYDWGNQDISAFTRVFDALGPARDSAERRFNITENRCI